MSDKYWFEPKKIGWGWVPISFEGWLLIIVLLFVVLMSGYVSGIYDDVTFWGLVFYFALFILEIIGFGYVAQKKTRHIGKSNKKKKRR